MIPRYTRAVAAEIWEDKYRLWLRIEIAAAETLAEHGLIPAATARSLKEVRVNPERVGELEAALGHDVVAFLTHLGEQMGEESRFIHYGMTSSDLLDTCLALQLRHSARILDEGLAALVEVAHKRALAHKRTPCIGRSHGVFAEPTSFGLKLLYAAAEFHRQRQRLAAAAAQISTCQLSGAVGTYAHLSPDIEETFATKLGLEPEPISSQVIPRDRHAFFFAVLAVIASSLERLAVEMRHLARSEVAEALEAFGSEQKGSSAMPHKKNPILAENITGLARLVRGYCLPFMENVALWHERDISHSSVERVAAPDAVVHLDFAIQRAVGLLEALDIRPAAMEANLKRAQGLYASQGVLLALVRGGLSREDAYRLVQTQAMRASGAGDFKSRLLALKEVRKALSAAELERLFDPTFYLKFAERIFKRVSPTLTN